MTDLFIGLMSGTSMDGIDAALVDFSSTTPAILATHSHSYPAELHRQLEIALELESPKSADLSEIDNAVGEVFAAAANTLLLHAGIQSGGVTAIGSHGQTIRHEPGIPEPYSLQIGNPEIIAARTNLDVVADFRTADIVAGGEGAPLVPAFHKAVFASETEYRVILNMGGIANITVLPPGADATVTGFDTGPGNTLMDTWVCQHLDASFDTGGQWAATGDIDHALLEQMLMDPYFHTTPPKSTGREYFNPGWLSQHITRHPADPQSVQATLCELTARTVADAIQSCAREAQRLITCGGGVHNTYMMERLKAHLPDILIDTTATHGIDPDWVEAAAFAWLAQQRLANKPGNIPSVTGANQPVLLGVVVRKNG